MKPSRSKNARLVGLCAWAFAWATAPLHLACGRVDYRGGDGDSTTTTSSSSSLECFDGELRLTETPCADGEFLVERCEAEVWSATEECRAPEVPCNEGEVIETEELCGEYEARADVGGIRDYNRVLEGCRGGVRQKVGCTCGVDRPTPDPPPDDGGESGVYVFHPEEEGKLKGQILGIEGVTFPALLWFTPTKVKTDLSHVRCVGSLSANTSFPEMSGLIAINSLQIEFPFYPYEDEPIVVPPLPALRKLYKVWVRGGDEVDLSGLEGLTELGELVIETTGNVDLSGLEYLTELGALDISTSADVDLSGLEYLTELGTLDISTSADVDLTALRNLRDLGVLSIAMEEEPLGITSLEGLEGIAQVQSVFLSPGGVAAFEVPALVNYEGLKNLEYVEKRMSVRRSVEGLKGLENLRSVGDLEADIVSEADMDVLANLEEVRGDLVLNLAQSQLHCSVTRLLEHVTVSGTITVNRHAWEDLKQLCEE